MTFFGVCLPSFNPRMLGHWRGFDFAVQPYKWLFINLEHSLIYVEIDIFSNNNKCVARNHEIKF